MIKPIGQRSLVEPYKAANSTESGLYLDTSTTDGSAPVKGTVLDVGEKSVLQKGDIIYFRRYSVDELKISTEKGEMVVCFVDDEDVLGVEKVA